MAAKNGRRVDGPLKDDAMRLKDWKGGAVIGSDYDCRGARDNWQ